MIQVKQLSKFYGSKRVLNNISCTFEKGKVYGVVGENGAGKTTFFRCIAGLEKFDGKLISGYTKFKNHLGFLATTPYMMDKMTGKEYIQLLLNAREQSVTELEAKNIFGLPLKQYAATYSTGMKKKLALTALLLQENDCLILDEPFNGVDIQSNILITAIIKQLKALEKTVIISSHIFSTLAEACDVIYVLSNGELIKEVAQKDFPSLEAEMRRVSIGNKVEQLSLK